MSNLIDNFSAEVYGPSLGWAKPDGEPVLEPVIIEILKSKPIQRLHKIEQHGPMVWAWKDAHETRYDHSVGVMLLIRRFGGSLEEQIAGLLHDVSHTAFSHAIDYSHRLNTKSFHEDNQERIIRQSEIPTILKKHQISLEDVIKSDHHKLLDTKLPNLCADRVDYCFRDGFAVGFVKMPAIKKMVKSLICHKGEIIFNDPVQAFKFAKLFVRNNKENYASDFSGLFNQVLADSLDIGIDEGIIEEADLFSDDESIKNKLLKSGNKEIIRLIGLISQKTKIIRAKKNFDYHLRVMRVRVVDPKILIDGKINRLSEINLEYKKLRDLSQTKQESGFFVKILPNARVVN
jgi:HD superfamily phosphohydrolase